MGVPARGSAVTRSTSSYAAKLRPMLCQHGTAVYRRYSKVCRLKRALSMDAKDEWHPSCIASGRKKLSAGVETVGNPSARCESDMMVPMEIIPCECRTSLAQIGCCARATLQRPS